MNNTIFNTKSEMDIKAIITREFIEASKDTVINFEPVDDINQLSLEERIENSNKAFSAECNRVHAIDKLEKMVTANNEYATKIYNAYINLIYDLYPMVARRQIAFNPNAKTINSIHNFAFMTARAKAYSIYENIIREYLTMKI